MVEDGGDKDGLRITANLKKLANFFRDVPPLKNTQEQQSKRKDSFYYSFLLLSYSARCAWSIFTPFTGAHSIVRS